MSQSPAATANHAARRAGSMLGRLARAWRAMPPERRLAVGAALGLFFTLFLPWYQETVVAAGKSASASLTGWAAFSFVEAAVLLVAAGVVTLLFQRAEGRAFHLPGGDGGVITGAGVWTCILVVWRILDKENVRVSGPGATASGVEWGIFLALAIAALLVYAGQRIRRAHTPEPPLPADDLDLWMPDGEPERQRSARRSKGAREARRPRPVRETRETPDTRETRETPDTRETRETRAARRARRTDATAPAPAPAPAPRRARAPRADAGHGFPAPEPLADPPTLRFGDMRHEPEGPAGDPDPRVTEQFTDEQLTIPFDESDRP
jgi:hypothetical protein